MCAASRAARPVCVSPRRPDPRRAPRSPAARRACPRSGRAARCPRRPPSPPPPSARRPARGAVTLVVEGAPCPGPVLDEGPGQAVDCWSIRAEVRSPPLFLVAGFAIPRLGNPHPTGEPNGFVDDAYLAMTTVVLLQG